MLHLRTWRKCERFIFLSIGRDSLSLIHRPDLQLYLYGGELTKIEKISWELIVVLISLWKVCIANKYRGKCR